MNIPILDSRIVLQNLKENKNPFWPQYYAFYSTWLGGITQDPALMVLPMDDHMVHRGDGVFEAIKTVNRKAFLMDAHLKRLEISAARISIELPFPTAKLQEIILQTLKIANQPNTLIRLFVSRGPGGFTTNPYDSVGSQLYIAITELRNPKPELYETGVKIGRSHVPIKDSSMAQIKSCNYLPNVLMKKEAVDRKLDFTIGFDSKNFVAESSTENIAIVDKRGNLVHPHFDHILRGTTMLRAFELAKAHGLPTEQRNFTEQEIIEAQEVMMIGTTLDVLPVTEYEGKKIKDGKVGAISQKLLQLVREDLKQGLSF